MNHLDTKEAADLTGALSLPCLLKAVYYSLGAHACKADNAAQGKKQHQL
jgi:hypothetical protein